MEIDLDGELAADLAAEAEERGFDTSEAYVQWLLEHREAVLTQPGERLASRVESLQGEIERLRAAIESDRPAFDAEHGAGSDQTVQAERDAEDETGGGGFEFGEAESADADVESDATEFPYSSSLEPPAEPSDQSGQSAASGDEGVTLSGTSEESDSPTAEDVTGPETEASGPADAAAAESAESDEGADDDEIADAIADIDLPEGEQPDNAERETDG